MLPDNTHIKPPPVCLCHVANKQKHSSTVVTGGLTAPGSAFVKAV